MPEWVFNNITLSHQEAIAGGLCCSAGGDCFALS